MSQCDSNRDVWGITWGITPSGTTSTKSCPGGPNVTGKQNYSCVLCYGDYTGKATRECLHNQTWGDTNVLNCHSDHIGRVVDEVKHYTTLHASSCLLIIFWFSIFSTTIIFPQSFSTFSERAKILPQWLYFHPFHATIHSQ